MARILHDTLTLWAFVFDGRQQSSFAGRKATGAELYAIHNLGFEGFRKAGFDLANCPAITRRKAKLIR
jgi:hypothetical protein